MEKGNGRPGSTASASVGHGESCIWQWMKQPEKFYRAWSLNNSCHDSEVLGELLDEITDPISQVDADGAYDTAACYDYIDEREAIAGIPPQRNAKIWFHGNRKTPRHPRDENLRKIRLVGRAKWKRLINYHRRSLAETTMFRFKTAFGGKVSSRQMERQVNELKVQCLVLNRMIQVAKPDSYAC